jgi:putative zinc finger/helix-turn-helix YgiT family protein
MPNFPMRCGICRERAVQPATIHYEATVAHDGREYAIVLPDLELLQCTACGNLVLDDAADNRISDALRAQVGLLRPDEIREHREALELTAEELAQYLGISAGTLQNWEQGVQIQSRGMDKLMRGFFDVPEYRSYLGHLAVAKASA